MSSRILFLCARGSSRSLIAASLLSAQATDRWDAWSSPTQDTHGLRLAKQGLSECGIPLISSDRLLQPAFGMRWDEGIILCSGATDVGPIIPGAGQHRLWSIEDPPVAHLSEEEQLKGYQGIRDALSAQIARELRFPSRLLNVAALHKGGLLQ